MTNKKCAMLPFNIRVNENLVIEKANAEIVCMDNQVVVFRPIQKETEIYLLNNGVEEVLEYNHLENIIIKC